MRRISLVPVSCLILAALAATGGLAAEAAPTAQATQVAITTPEEFFGFRLGADRQLARWDRIVAYFRTLERESDRIRVTDLGPSTEGHPFLLVLISSPENLAEADRLAEVSRLLADPRGLSDAEIDALIDEGKAVVAQSLGLHATEVAGAQTAPELAYDLLARDDEETRRILDETILLLLPCINPDGQIMVADWYRQTVDTEYEGSGLPWLYHKYVGHDNNRDGDYLNMVESVYMARILYREWKPQAYVDHHQMGSYGARFYVPPYSEPIRPYADPLMWRELAWYGAHIAYKLEEHGKKGVLNAAQYPGWGHFGWHWITPFHNIAGMLTESASATLATPLYLHPDQPSGGARGLPEYEAQSNMPNPWPGGWWRLRDIVEQQKIAAWALQDMAARNRETVLRNAVRKALRQTERGATESPKAYIVPAAQHDAPTAVRMINTLLQSDVEIHRASRAFSVGGMTYGAGTFVIPLAQPKTGLVRNLLGRTLYPDNEWTRARDGSPMRPYDTATHTMAELMGVRVDPVDAVIEGELTRLADVVAPGGAVAEGASLLVLDGRHNNSFKAVNLLLDRGVSVSRAHAAAGVLRPGDFVVAAGGGLAEVVRAAGVDARALAEAPTEGVHDVERRRVAMYQRYGGGNMDEGWTRFLLEDFAFPYTSLKDAELKAGDLADRYDVILLPHDSPAAIRGRESDDRGRRSIPPPPEYRSGIGDEGVEALRQFVRDGGTLVAFGAASELAIDAFELAVRDVVDGVPSTEFFCPGSTLRLRFDTTDPLAWGMPEEGLGLFWASPAFEITPSPHNDDYRRVAAYPDRDLLQSGWLIGEEHLARKAAVVSASYGEGAVVLLGIRAQHRSQTHGTFKLLFNALIR